MDILYSLEAEYIFPDVSQLNAGNCLCTSRASAPEREIDLSRRIILTSLGPPDGKSGQGPLWRASGQPAMRTAWKVESCSGIPVMRPGRHFNFGFIHVYVPDGCLGWGHSICPFCTRSGWTSHQLFPWLLFPGQVQLVLLNTVSWIFSAHFEVNKGSDFPVILTHHWHLCVSLPQSRTNTKTTSWCTLCTKSLQM